MTSEIERLKIFNRLCSGHLCGGCELEKFCNASNQQALPDELNRRALKARKLRHPKPKYIVTDLTTNPLGSRRIWYTNDPEKIIAWINPHPSKAPDPSYIFGTVQYGNRLVIVDSDGDEAELRTELESIDIQIKPESEG